jgi:hypothetical protein
MGYYTKHYITADPPTSEKTVTVASITDSQVVLSKEDRLKLVTVTYDHAAQALRYLEAQHAGYGEGPIKWYDHERDMRAVSQHIRDVTFSLVGYGEEHADIWVKYFRNGKMQTGAATVTFVPFNEKEAR